jgi:hypothetical protein
MTGRRWPILCLDEDATETEIRRAYARCLREQGAEADATAFQALRSEFEAALAVARSGSNAGPPRGDGRPARDGTQTLAATRSRAIRDEIVKYLDGAELVRACDRFERARSTDELEHATANEIELRLAESWLANTTLDTATLAQIVRQLHWDDVGFDFLPGTEIAEKLEAALSVVRRPGQRYAGEWNWGAFLLTPFWLISHGLRRRGAYLLFLTVASAVFLPGLFAIVWYAINYGRSGNRIAAANRTFASDDEFVAVQNAWRNRGFLVAVLVLAIVPTAFAWIVTLFR